MRPDDRLSVSREIFPTNALPRTGGPTCRQRLLLLQQERVRSGLRTAEFAAGGGVPTTRRPGGRPTAPEVSDNAAVCAAASDDIRRQFAASLRAAARNLHFVC